MNLASFLTGLREWTVLILCVLACLFALGGAIGLFRFKDSYERLQASSLLGTTAPFTILLACLVTVPSSYMIARLVLILVFFFISSPTATHIIARYAWQSGLEPERPEVQKRQGEKGDTDD